MGKDTVEFGLYNIYGQVVKKLILLFNFQNNTLNGKNVVEDEEYTIKIMKTKIKSRGGIKKLYKEIKEANREDSALNLIFYGALENI